MRKFGLPLLLFALCAGTAYQLAVHNGFLNPYPVVCELVAEKIFLKNSEIGPWKTTCLRRSSLVKADSPKQLIFKDINNVLGLLNVSHLELYDSALVKTIWHGESKETGIESEFVDGELVVFKTHPQSPASEAGIRAGDIVVSINNEQPNPWEAQASSGTYLVKRSSGLVSIDLETREIVRDEKPSTSKINAQTTLIKIPSFRSQFFEYGDIQSWSQTLLSSKQMIVDLRGNAGGNFVAGLRFLSLFLCEKEEVGRLLRPRAVNTQSAALPDDLRDESQLAVLENNGEVLLRTFDKKACYKGQVRVLVDGKTASVAEMVAQALKEFRQALVMGTPTRGQLLVGVWYPLEEMGPGVQISIPEAVYLSRQKHKIEGQGVELDKLLYYDLGEMQAGVDSWVQSALD